MKAIIIIKIPRK